MSASEQLRVAINGDRGAQITLPPPSDPVAVARAFVERRFTRQGEPALLHWRGGWWTWVGPRWVEIERGSMSAAAYALAEHATYESDRGPVAWSPNRRKVGDLLDALAGIAHLSQDVQMPSWLDGRAYNGRIVACANGLLDVGTRTLLPHSPLFFNATSVPFDYDPDAPSPERWYRFLLDLWGDDEASIAALGEWFGYVISGRLDLQKILLLVGPTRAGKGVIARTLEMMVGRENTAGPTLSSFANEFGLQPLLGKTLAVISDARLNGRGANVVVERLLSISGEDTLSVNRKNREHWIGKLPARLMLCSNELPQLGDASMAVAGRFVPLLLERSWWGKEDLDLEEAIAAELPGVLNWALDGLERLNRTRRFTEVSAADEAIRALKDLASPVNAFLRDCCVAGADEQIPVKGLYRAWTAWAQDNGHAKASVTTFGRDLRAALGGRLKVARVGGHASSERERVYVGVALTSEAETDLAAREERLM